MGFLDTPRRPLPAKIVIDYCPVCNQQTLNLEPCSHWFCNNCGYSTFMTNSTGFKDILTEEQINELRKKLKYQKREQSALPKEAFKPFKICVNCNAEYYQRLKKTRVQEYCNDCKNYQNVVPLKVYQNLEIDFNNVSECAKFLLREKERLEEENKQLKQLIEKAET